MSNAETAVNLIQIAKDYDTEIKKVTKRIIICAGTGCVANGALKVHKEFQQQIEAEGIRVDVELVFDDSDINENDNGSHERVLISKSGCQGFCQMGPLVTILPDNFLYVKVKAEDVAEIVQKTLISGEAIERLLYIEPATGARCRSAQDINFYKRQQRTVLKNCGAIEAEDINEYIYMGGYTQAERACKDLAAEQICDEIIASGLRGRGGGGFPTGRKWDITRKQNVQKKYIICNGDEGDPGAFMDRSVMEGNPHSVLEGMIIAGKAIGADEGFVYVRAEYPLAVKRLRKAVEDARALGILGSGIFGTEFNFEINVMEGAGAFVCGEETALMASIEGKRGMPMPKPPFPAQSGLWEKPTLINNVETFASVPIIMKIGASAFKGTGTATSPGTKTFALTGHIVNTGLIEAPFGTTLREIVENIGGGVPDDSGNISMENFKAAQIGGPSGGCLTEAHLDLSLDFDSLKKVGAMVGSGGLVIMNKNTCMVSIARFFMQFTQNESCGKCVPCREGTKQMLALLDDIIEGRGTAKTLSLLETLARAVQKSSLCGLGKTAPSPVLSTLANFRAEYEAHVYQKRCPAGKCKALLIPEIDKSKCIGCTACSRKCPVNAITGEKKQPHIIDAGKCIKCGVCAQVCKFDAVKGIK